MTQVSFLPLGFKKEVLMRLMQEAGVGGIVLTSPENIFYVTGFPGLFSSGNPILYGLRNVLPFFTFVSQQGKIILMCWGGAATGIEYGADEVLTYSDIDGAWNALVDTLRANKTDDLPLGIESSTPYLALNKIQQIVSNVVLADDILMQTRTIKSPQEVALLEKSINVVEQAVSELMEMVHIGIRRPLVMQEAKTSMLRHGASGISHVTISFGASNPEVEIDEALQPGKLVTLDLGAIVNGYYSDNRRLMYTGEVPAGMANLHRTMCGIVDEVAGKLAPDVSFGEIYDFAMQLYDKHQLEPFIPNIGHTIGMQVEEIWIYEENRDVLLQPGMVLNLEMYTLYETGELIGDEETYAISADGYRQLTHLPTAIRSITQ